MTSVGLCMPAPAQQCQCRILIDCITQITHGGDRLLFCGDFNKKKCCGVISYSHGTSLKILCIFIRIHFTFKSKIEILFPFN